jgi:hypothetical protein
VIVKHEEEIWCTYIPFVLFTVSGIHDWTSIKTRARNMGSVTSEIPKHTGGLPARTTVTSFGMWS